MHTRAPALKTGLVVSALLAVPLVSTPAAASPEPSLQYAGIADVETNGFGGIDSWAGSYRLFTGPDETGEVIAGFCIDRGLDYPAGTDPDDPNSGFEELDDVLEQRGATYEQRMALSFALWKWGSSEDPTTAAAMFLLVHDLSADPAFGGDPNVYDAADTVEAAVLGPDWPDGPAVKALALEMKAEAIAERGPWKIEAEMAWVQSDVFEVSVEVDGSGGPIAGEELEVVLGNAADGPAGPLVTDSEGRVSFDVHATDLAKSVTATATIPAPGLYRVFWGAGGTQRVVAADGGSAHLDFGAAHAPLAGVQVHKATTNPAYQSGEGARFELHRGGADGPVVGELHVGADGNSNVVEGLVGGAYTLIEIGVPDGQVLDPEPLPVQLVPGEVLEVDAVNDVDTEGRITLHKVDARTDDPAPGALLALHRDADGDGHHETPVGHGPDGKPGTDDDGRYLSVHEPLVVTGLLTGDYLATEVAPPPGFAPTVADPIALTLTYGEPAAGDEQLSGTAVFANVRAPAVAGRAVRARLAYTGPSSTSHLESVGLAGLAALVAGFALVVAASTARRGLRLRRR